MNFKSIIANGYCQQIEITDISPNFLSNNDAVSCSTELNSIINVEELQLQHQRSQMSTAKNKYSNLDTLNLTEVMFNIYILPHQQDIHNNENDSNHTNNDIYIINILINDSCSSMVSNKSFTYEIKLQKSIINFGSKIITSILTNQSHDDNNPNEATPRTSSNNLKLIKFKFIHNSQRGMNCFKILSSTINEIKIILNGKINDFNFYSNNNNDNHNDDRSKGRGCKRPLDTNNSNCYLGSYNFQKQEQCFQFYDSILHNYCHNYTYNHNNNNSFKLFTYESNVDGRRLFNISNFQTFQNDYFKIPSHDRHVYEIIRENFPCRAYFDVEFSKPSNEGLNGDSLLNEWMAIVVWKIHQLFDISLDASNIVVLDSTTDVKYSKHINLIIDESDSSTYKSDNSNNSNNNPHQKEYLFSNNFEVGYLVQIILLDLSDLFSNNQNNSLDNDKIIFRSSITGQQRVVKKQYEHFWTCFVDTGVYTRNRAFRIFGSCKYGKTKCLSVLNDPDKKNYYGISHCYSLSSNGSTKQNNKNNSDSYHRKALYSNIFANSFIIPYDIFVSRSSNKNDSDANTDTREDRTIRRNLLTTVSMKQSCDDKNEIILPMKIVAMTPDHIESSSHNSADLTHRNIITSDSIMVENNTLQRIGDDIIVNKSTITASDDTNSKISVSPVDNIYLWHHNHLNYDRYIFLPSIKHNTIPATIQAWSSSSFTSSIPLQLELPSLPYHRKLLLKSKNNQQPSMFPSLDEFISHYHISKGGVQGLLNGWHLYREPGPNPDFPILKIKYQISRNRWCENIQRAHKSNGVMMDVDLMNGELTQTCWDCDCKGFRSNPIILPTEIIPPLDKLVEIMNTFS
eukprot:gene6236-8591_t